MARQRRADRSDGEDARANSSSDSECGSGEPQTARQRAQHELKKAAEKKFRQRYLLLQQAYEQRLQALAAQVRHVVAELQSDSTIDYLQQDPLTTEYANARVAEIIQECFFGEREKYIKVVSDQIAWQSDDLREAEQRVRAVQRKEKAAQSKLRTCQSDLQDLHQKLELRAYELGEKERIIARTEDALRKVEQERDEFRKETERLRERVAALERVKYEYEGFQVRTNEHREEERARYESAQAQIEQLREERDRLDEEKQHAERNIERLQQLLSVAEKQNNELAQSIKEVRAEDYSTRLLKTEHELAKQRHANEELLKENEQLKKKYEEFGAQVEVYLEEQSRERADVVRQSEEKEQKLKEELSVLRAHSSEALKFKQNELLRIADQVKFRQDALAKAEQKISHLEERVSALDSTLAEEKLRGAKAVNELEKEVTRLRLLLEREQEQVKAGEAALTQTKETYEQKFFAMQDALDQQQQQSHKERELEARTKWQNEFVAKQEARIEALKSKYDAAIEAQQDELLRARQLAVEAAKSAAEKVEEVKSIQLAKRDDDLEAKKRRQELREAERVRAETERAKEAALRQMQKELDDRGRRLRELEQKLEEKERQEQRRMAEEAAENEKKKKTDSPRVVVVNVNGTDELEAHEDTIGPQGVALIARRQKQTLGSSRAPPRYPADNQEHDSHEGCIPIAQHQAELQARDAQVALEAEKRVQKEVQDFQERKEKELRNAMVNVRKGIQKLEISLEAEKKEKKRFEDELLCERQAFIALKAELEESAVTKRTLSQRLEEANSNIGKLRDLVKMTEEKYASVKEKLNLAVQSDAASQQRLIALQTQLEENEAVTGSLQIERSNLQNLLEKAKKSESDLYARVQELENRLADSTNEFAEERTKMMQVKEAEVRRMKDEFTKQIELLKQRFESRDGEAMQLQEQVEGTAKSMEHFQLERQNLEQKAESLSFELQRQRKEFNDLARLHKNLSEVMRGKLQDEQSRYTQLELRFTAAKQSCEALRLSKQAALEQCHNFACLLKDEYRELRKAAGAEIKAAWKSAKKETQLHAKLMLQRIEKMKQQERAILEQAVHSEREIWAARLEKVQQDVQATLTTQQVSDKVKHDELVSRLHDKSEQLLRLQRESNGHILKIKELQAVIQQLETEKETKVLEQSELANELSNSRVITRQEIEAKQRLEALVTAAAHISQVFLKFVRHVMRELGLDSCSVLSISDSDLKHPERWQADELSNDLGRLMELLLERISSKEAAASASACHPLQAELSAAKEMLTPFVDLEEDNFDESLSKHLPWYVVVVRSVKSQMTHLRREAEELRNAVSVKSLHVDELEVSIEKMRQVQAGLLFEKETLTHEMGLQIQSLQKKREADLEHQKEEYDRRIEQLQRRQTSEQLKLKEESEIALDQLKEALEAEKKSHSRLKQELMMARAEHEKNHVEIQDRAGKLEKELESVRDELAKWKRKAKLSAKSPGTPSRRSSVLFSPSVPTDDGDSESPFSSMYPPPRRPSSAMVDLSNLMERSLHDLRKDNEAMTPTRQPAPSLLLQSPMRRASGAARPSPLRIPMHPSPARKRTALVPPPRLINTATSQLTTPPPIPR